jgi:hypothetical protein
VKNDWWVVAMPLRNVSRETGDWCHPASSRNVSGSQKHDRFVLAAAPRRVVDVERLHIVTMHFASTG